MTRRKLSWQWGVKAGGAREGRAINETRYDVASLHTTGKALQKYVRGRKFLENF